MGELNLGLQPGHGNIGLEKPGFGNLGLQISARQAFGDDGGAARCVSAQLLVCNYRIDRLSTMGRP